MVAIEAISKEIHPLGLESSLDEALRTMDQGRFLGLIYHGDILAHKEDDDKQKVADLENDLIKVYVNKSQHLYELVKVADEFDLNLIPVVEENEEDGESEWVGTVLLQDLVRWFAHTVSIKEPGGIIVISVDRKDFAMTQIAQIVEGNEARILSSYVSSEPGSHTLDVILKLDRQDIDAVIQTFERYDYRIKATYQESRIEEDLRDKFEELMNYINM
jgi:hypothetical protein